MISKERLDRLQRDYGAPLDTHFSVPEFRRVADILFKGGRRRFPYEGVPTFLDAPYRPADTDDGALTNLDIALVGVPLDLGVTNRPGARFGPRAVRAIERIGPYDHALQCLPMDLVRVADVGDVPLKSRYDLPQSHTDIRTFFDRIVRAGIAPIAVGGDHGISHPILQAVGAKEPVGLIHIDAHCDTSGPFEGAKFHHGGPFRLAVLDGVLDPERTIQIGIRGAAEWLWGFSYDSGMTVIHAEEIGGEAGIPAIIDKAKAVVGKGPVYVSFDIDSIDPAFACGTGTPEVGGLTPREVLALLRGLAGLNIVGGDVVEVAPHYDPSPNTATVGAQMLFEILCLVALARSRT